MSLSFGDRVMIAMLAQDAVKNAPPRKYPIGHSVILWFLFGWTLLWIPPIYYTFSKKHYWHW